MPLRVDERPIDIPATRPRKTLQKYDNAAGRRFPQVIMPKATPYQFITPSQNPQGTVIRKK
jgi:hypothetical protein